MSLPNAYCVKCGKQTETKQKHTVLLQNNSRALHGVCASCESEVYRVLPKKKQNEMIAAEQPRLSLVKPVPLNGQNAPRVHGRIEVKIEHRMAPSRRMATTMVLSNKTSYLAAGAVIGAIIACFVLYTFM